MDFVELQAENQALKERLEAKTSETRILLEALKEKDQRIQFLTDQLRNLNRNCYGPSSEKVDPHQLLLEFAEGEDPTPTHALEAPDAEEELKSGIGKKKRRPPRGRKPIPQDLPRERVVYEIPEQQRTCTCCGDPMQPFGEEITEELEAIPASLVVIEHVRTKYSCKQCQDGVAIAPLPNRPIAKGKPGPGLLAKTVVAKYADHLPLHRQQKIYQREGLDVPKSTLCDWIAASAQLLKPISLEIKRQILQSKVVQTDDTPVMMQENYKKGGRKRCFLWAYRGQEGEVYFDFTTSRSRAGPLRFFQDYRGYVQADAYSGYDALFRRDDVVEVGCWAHARRYFYQALQGQVEEAAPAMASIRRLYQLEKELQDRSPEERRQLRQDKAKPILENLKAKLKLEQSLVLPKSSYGKAIGYALRHWEALNRYLEDGDLTIDNNACEREIRSVAIGRKNWLFAGSKAGGERAAILYSIIQTCRACKVEPWAYLKDVLSKIHTTPKEKIAELTPRAWKRNKD